MTDIDKIQLLTTTLVALAIVADDASEVIGDDEPVKIDLADAISKARHAIAAINA